MKGKKMEKEAWWDVPCGFADSSLWMRLGTISAPPPDTVNTFRPVVNSAVVTSGIDFTVTTSPHSNLFCYPPSVMVWWLVLMCTWVVWLLEGSSSTHIVHNTRSHILTWFSNRLFHNQFAAHLHQRVAFNERWWMWGWGEWWPSHSV